MTTVVVTGGTGSFGQAFVRHVLKVTDWSVRVLSRDEHKQEAMAREIPTTDRLTYILADIRDADRLRTAFDGADIIVHAAALKIVPMAERHTYEYIATNVMGTWNVCRAAIESGVKRVMFIGTDKSVAPYNAYGKSKAMAEALVVYANQEAVRRGTALFCVRGGNVWATRGSVALRWRAEVAAGMPITVTSSGATRFHLPMDAWLEFCMQSIMEAQGGEILVPNLRSWRLGDLAAAFGVEQIVVGRRDGDKEHEVMLAPEETPRVRDLGWAYVVEPSSALQSVMAYAPRGEPYVYPSFVYSSQTADRLGMDELRSLVEAL